MDNSDLDFISRQILQKQSETNDLLAGIKSNLTAIGYFLFFQFIVFFGAFYKVSQTGWVEFWKSIFP